MGPRCMVPYKSYLIYVRRLDNIECYLQPLYFEKKYSSLIIILWWISIGGEFCNQYLSSGFLKVVNIQVNYTDTSCLGETRVGMS